MTGILLVDKPEGVSSASVIRALKPRLGRAKIGHLGTLDPFASGLLPLCLGEATKVARYLLVEGKAYTGTIRLGSATDTLDRTGVACATSPVPALSPDTVAAVAERFRGTQRQVPPMYSALKRGGVPLYKLARRGIEVEREAREVEIAELSLVVRGGDRLDFTVVCSKGTYVRVLASDIGQALGTVAHLERLRRTRVGTFRVEDASPLGRLTDGEDAPLDVMPVRQALARYPALTISEEALARLRRGQQADLARLRRASRSGETALLLAPDGTVAGIIEASGPEARWRVVRLLAE